MRTIRGSCHWAACQVGWICFLVTLTIPDISLLHNILNKIWAASPCVWPDRHKYVQGHTHTDDPAKSFWHAYPPEPTAWTEQVQLQSWIFDFITRWLSWPKKAPTFVIYRQTTQQSCTTWPEGIAGRKKRRSRLHVTKLTDTGRTPQIPVSFQHSVLIWGSNR